jgi:hypothetical protein
MLFCSPSKVASGVQMCWTGSSARKSASALDRFQEPGGLTKRHLGAERNHLCLERQGVWLSVISSAIFAVRSDPVPSSIYMAWSNCGRDIWPFASRCGHCRCAPCVCVPLSAARCAKQQPALFIAFFWICAARDTSFAAIRACKMAWTYAYGKYGISDEYTRILSCPLV